MSYPSKLLNLMGVLKVPHICGQLVRIAGGPGSPERWLGSEVGVILLWTVPLNLWNLCQLHVVHVRIVL